MTVSPDGAVVAVVGDVLVDVVVAPDGPVVAGSDTPSRITWRQGGAAANTAAWLAQLDVPVRLVGRIGADAAGTAIAQGLAMSGVQTRLAVDARRGTGTVVALIRIDERDMFTSRGAAAALAPTDLPDGWLADVAHLHLSGYTLLSGDTRPAGLAALRAASDAGIGISVDPASAGPLRAAGAEAFLAWLPAGTLLTPNLAEARVLTGCQDPVAAVQALARRCGEAVVTLGAQGAMWSDGTAMLHTSAQSVGAGDPVGAGDAFTAGLLAVRRRGADVAQQLAAGCLAAGRAVRGERPVPEGFDPQPG
ncbi:MAG TPA: PfkB family carbohydrate kinase [Euzebya sp.]|nr:PfkB family carbohydrate kinase [Euzebya sp.]